jgi:hypothetical protein
MKAIERCPSGPYKNKSSTRILDTYIGLYQKFHFLLRVSIRILISALLTYIFCPFIFGQGQTQCNDKTSVYTTGNLSPHAFFASWHSAANSTDKDVNNVKYNFVY